eukprot:2384543-Amphidinium_carterae.1
MSQRNKYENMPPSNAEIRNMIDQDLLKQRTLLVQLQVVKFQEMCRDYLFGLYSGLHKPCF